MSHADPACPKTGTDHESGDCAARWWSLLSAEVSAGAAANATTQPLGHSVPAPACSTEALAELATLTLKAGKSLLVLVPDDEFLPGFSNALDIGLRPLCLVLPSADFAARIAMRATLSLLRSRLTRGCDDGQESIWATQKERIASNPHLWREVQDWNGSNARSDWPPAAPQLFPVRILPVAAFRTQPRVRADIAVCYCCDPGMDTALLGNRLLFVGGRAQQQGTRVPAFVDEHSRLTVELAQLTQDVGELELELATAQAEMADFTRRYYGVVGRRMTELDVLQAKLARCRLDTLLATPGAEAPASAARTQAQNQYEERVRQAERSRAESRRFAQAEHESEPGADSDGPSLGTPRAFRPDAGIKRQFRQLAQRIHPDRAVSEADRAWRTQLMSEANRAYRSGNAQALAEVAALWDEGVPRTSAPTSTSATTQVNQTNQAPHDMLRHQIAAMRARFDAIRQELHRLFGSKLYELFLAARQIGRFGRDLLQEMADRLDAQIGDVLAALRALGDDGNAPDEFHGVQAEPG